MIRSSRLSAAALAAATFFVTQTASAGATFSDAQPPVSPLWNVERSEMKLTPNRAGPPSTSSWRNGELLVTPTAIGASCESATASR